ncbi:ATP-binding cassette domain-containing protein [Candidatus Parabeggiatoa sp. HSG14]|uniref:ATP-binding cassette domain-containing protein n=1 Tax=Candidatus Parabeggiatoa sp. HSG14 TaxID=3055593 RepID=UPI0025A7D0E9|nr:ATP-binding cassette domain-containing protein [Thiotrichales bacterium HSG14]
MITLRNFSLQRGIKPLFNQVNVTFHASQKIGFIGANGCGKSSLFALLRGELHQDMGDVELPSKLTIAHVAQEIPAVSIPAIEYVLNGDHELREIETQLAIAQNAKDGMREAHLHAQFEAIDGYTARVRASQFMHGLGFAFTDDEKPVNEFSGGWRMRLNLAQALMCRSDLLLLDEPTNHLDLDAVLWFEQWLKRYQGTLLLISHDRDFLDNVVDTIAHIEQQRINLYTGNYEDYERQRAAKLALQQAAYQKQQREIVHVQSFIDRFRYKATKAKQAQSRITALARMEKIAPAHVDSIFHFGFESPIHIPNLLLDLDKVSIGYGDKPILEQIKLRISPGSRLGLLGPNGAGKSTLIKLLAGMLEPMQGERTLGDGLQIGYFAQHQLEQLESEESPLKHLQRLDTKATEQTLRNFLGGFGFLGDIALEPIAPFSGGEKARLALALLVWQKPNVLLLDEPTNHLDLEMRHALTLALQDYVGALVIVSHDRHLLRTTTDQLLLVANRCVKTYEGDLTDYRQWLLEHRAEQRKSPLTSLDKREGLIDSLKTSNKALLEKKRLEAKQREQRRPLRNRLKNIEKELDKLVTDKAAVEALLANPTIYEDKEKVKEYIHQQTTLAEKLQKVEEDWLEITEELEALA